MDKRYTHTVSEQEAQAKWEQEKTYVMSNNPGPLYSIDTPPPTISGSLHIGHIFSYTQTDIFARFKRMEGFSVLYPFGFDNNGLATERFVEKKCKIRAHELSRSVFIKMCQQESTDAAKEFKTLWQRMGLSVDWTKCYSTIAPETQKISQESFIRLFEKGHIYRHDEPALYCTQCRTSVAQAELDDVECDSYFNDIIFSDAQGKDLVIGTTRPELLPSCVALLYHPHDERYKHLRGTKVRVPLFDYEVPVFADEAVAIDKGTGLVMCCTFGDKTDIEWFKKFKLPYKQSIGFDGKWQEDTGPLAGLKVKEARAKVLELLREEGKLVTQKPITHAVNVHERCKTPIEYVMITQWFLRILEHKKELLALADTITWHPSFMKTRYINWVENLSWDWCLSRQRRYGIPFPVWHCADCKQILLARIEDLPIDPQETPFSGQVCTQCGGTNIVPDTDVMDTWNTSSLTPYLVYGYFNKKAKSPFTDEQIGEFLPMSMRAQAHDIIRTWAFYTMIKTWMHHGVAPWKDIVISGHVLSDAKQKLSKSQGGGNRTPQALLDQYSADAIRYWTASGSLGTDVAFSEAQLKIGGRLATKLWNAFRFVGAHIEGVDPNRLPEAFGVVNEWLLHRATECFTRYRKYLGNYEFSLALEAAERFFWKDFCDTYLEMIKHQLFNQDAYKKEEIEATLWTLHTVGLRILQLYGPYMPHVTETIFTTLYAHGSQSLHQTKFEGAQQAYEFDKSKQVMERVLHIIAQVRKLKTEKALSLKAPLKKLTIYVEDARVIEQVQRQEQLIKGVVHADHIAYEVEPSAVVALRGSEDELHAHVSYQ